MRARKAMRSAIDRFRRAAWLGVLLTGLALLWGPAAAAEPMCEPDDGLSRAARVLLRRGGTPTPADLRRALQRAGSSAIGVHAFLLSPPTDSPAGRSEGPRVSSWDPRLSRWLRRQAQRGAGVLRCGHAALRGPQRRQRLWLAAPRAGGLQVAPSRRLTGWLAQGFGRPEVVVAFADGRTERHVLRLHQLRRGWPMPRERGRVTRIQLLAWGPDGPQPVAERVFEPAPRAEVSPAEVEGAPLDLRHVRVAGPIGSPAGALDAPPDAGDVLARRLQAMRRARAVGRVRAHRLLRALAGRQAAAVCEAGRVVHRLEPDQGPDARVRRAGLQAAQIGEVVARAETPEAAFAALRRSPSHRMTLSAPGFTDAGVGVAQDLRGHACVVVLLARWPRFVGRGLSGGGEEQVRSR